MSCALAAAMGLALTAALFAQPPDGPPPANVRVGLVQRERVLQKRLVIGRIEPARRTTLTAEEPGRVTKAPPEAGLPVTAADIIAKVDDTLLKIDRDAAAATVLEAEALVAERTEQLALLERDRQRIAELVASDVAKQKELDDAINEEQAARARLALAVAQLVRSEQQKQRLDTRIEKTSIKPPFDAYIVRKQTELGQWLDPGDPIVELVEIHNVKVRLDVPQSLIGAIPQDEPITLHIDALDIDRNAKLFSIVPDADVQSRTFSVLIKLSNADGQLKPGMSVSAELPTGQRIEALTVPRDAVIVTPVGHTVYVNRGGRAVALGVKIRWGADDGRFVIADSALRPGDEVIIEGNERLFPGQPLNVIADDPAPTSPTAEAPATPKG